MLSSPVLADGMTARDYIEKLYWRAEKLVAPCLVQQRVRYEVFLDRLVRPETRWLDVGCGHQVLPSWLAAKERELVARCAQVVGLDSDADAISKHQTITNVYKGDAEQLPFPDVSFDLVTANMVLEHVAEPKRVFSEVARVLASGGKLLLHTPNVYGYPTILARMVPRPMRLVGARILDGRKACDVYPTYYRANSMKRLRELSAEKFTIAESAEFSTMAVFGIIPPIGLLELLWMRIIQMDGLHSLRSNLIVVLSKKS